MRSIRAAVLAVAAAVAAATTAGDAAMAHGAQAGQLDAGAAAGGGQGAFGGVGLDLFAPGLVSTPAGMVDANAAPPRLLSAKLPNGMSMALPGNVFAAELPYAAGLARGDAQTFASAAASLSANPALAAAVRSQANLKLTIGKRITQLEAAAATKQQAVAAAVFELSKARNALLLAQRDAFMARAQLAASHRQLAALDVNARRLADAARLNDLNKALALTEASLRPGSVLTETQRVMNSQLQASLLDTIAATKARMDEATRQIDSILAGHEPSAAAEAWKEAEKVDDEAHKAWTKAQELRTQAERANIVRAHALALAAHEAVTHAGAEAAKGTPVADPHHHDAASGGHPPAPAAGEVVPAGVVRFAQKHAAAAAGAADASGEEEQQQEEAAAAEEAEEEEGQQQQQEVEEEEAPAPAGSAAVQPPQQQQRFAQAALPPHEAAVAAVRQRHMMRGAAAA